MDVSGAYFKTVFLLLFLQQSIRSEAVVVGNEQQVTKDRPFM